MTMNDFEQQKLDDEAQQKQALEILDRIKKSCGEKEAEDAAYLMGVGTIWKRMSEKEAA